MSYATVEDVQNGMTRTMSEREQEVCASFLEEAAVIIDCYNIDANEDIKKTVSCMMVRRALSDDGSIGIPVGATQGTISAGSYSQTFTMSNGAVGELYLSKLEKRMLGIANRIGSYSPVQELVNAR